VLLADPVADEADTVLGPAPNIACDLAVDENRLVHGGRVAADIGTGSKTVPWERCLPAGDRRRAEEPDDPANAAVRRQFAKVHPGEMHRGVGREQ